MKHVATISSDGDRREHVLWVITLIVSACVDFFHVFVLADRPQEGMVVVLAVIDLIPLALLAVAVRVTLHNRRYGRLELELDPSPGSLGGDVGGLVDVPIILSGDGDFRVTLACERRTETFDGQDTHVRWRVLWRGA